MAVMATRQHLGTIAVDHGESAVRRSLCPSLLALLAGVAAPALAWDPADLVGTVYYRRCLDCSDWVGVPPDVEDTYGSMISSSSSAPQSFGVQGFRRPDGSSFLTFDLMSNFADGRAYNRVLGVLDTTGTQVMYCSPNGPEIVAVLTPEEHAWIQKQPINAMEGRLATLRHPSKVYRMNTRSLAIEPIDGAGIVCVGFPRG